MYHSGNINGVVLFDFNGVVSLYLHRGRCDVIVQWSNEIVISSEWFFYLAKFYMRDVLRDTGW